MDFIKSIDLNKLCRVLDYVAVIAFIFGIIVTLGLGIHADGHSRYAEAYDWTTIICGFCVSLLNGLFLLFLSRIGKAIDDIRNKYVS